MIMANAHPTEVRGVAKTCLISEQCEEEGCRPTQMHRNKCAAKSYIPKCREMQCRKRHAEARRKAAVNVGMLEDNKNMNTIPLADKISCSIVSAS